MASCSRGTLKTVSMGFEPEERVKTEDVINLGKSSNTAIM